MPAPVLVNEIHAHLDWFGNKTNFKDYFSQISAEQLFRQPELAMTLERIANQGSADFYRGETARLIVEQMEKDDGLISWKIWRVTRRSGESRCRPDGAIIRYCPRLRPVQAVSGSFSC